MRNFVKRLLGVAVLGFAGLAACVGDDPAAANGGGQDAGTSSSEAGGCASDEKLCATGCVKLSDPAYGCGAIACNACPADDTRHQAAVCTSAGQCGFDATCAAGYSDCDKNTGNGCEIATGTDPLNCGTCGVPCGVQNASAPPKCSNGACTFTCVAGYAHCQSSNGTGCETNTDNDPKNCGACGHDCLGGTCNAGMCQPTFLTDPKPTYVTIDPGAAGFVYWSNAVNGGTVRRALKDFTNPVTIATASGQPLGVLKTTSFIYWTENGGTSTLHYANPDGTGPNTLATQYTQPWWVAADATTAYLVNRGDTNVVVKAALGTSVSTPLVTKNAAQDAVKVAVDADYVYVETLSGGLYRYDKATGANEKLLGSGAFDFVVDGNDVYYTLLASGTQSPIYKIGRDGTCGGAMPCPQTVLNSANAFTGHITVDAKHIYYTTIPQAQNQNGTPTLMRADKDGKNVTTLYTRASDASNGSVVVDDTQIYWSVQTDGTANGRVYRLAK